MKTVNELAHEMGLATDVALDLRDTLLANHGLVGVWVYGGKYYWRAVHAPDGAAFYDREAVLNALEQKPEGGEQGQEPEGGAQEQEPEGGEQGQEPEGGAQEQEPEGITEEKPKKKASGRGGKHE